MQLHADDGPARDPGGSPFACESCRARPRERRAVGARPNRRRGVCRGACSQSLAKHQRWPAGGWRLLLGECKRSGSSADRLQAAVRRDGQLAARCPRRARRSGLQDSTCWLAFSALSGCRGCASSQHGSSWPVAHERSGQHDHCGARIMDIADAVGPLIYGSGHRREPAGQTRLRARRPSRPLRRDDRMAGHAGRVANALSAASAGSARGPAAAR